MTDVRVIKRGHPRYVRGRPEVHIEMGARDALEFGRWLQDEKHGDVALGNELVKAAHEAWEENGS